MLNFGPFPTRQCNHTLVSTYEAARSVWSDFCVILHLQPQFGGFGLSYYMYALDTLVVGIHSYGSSWSMKYPIRP